MSACKPIKLLIGMATRGSDLHHKMIATLLSLMDQTDRSASVVFSVSPHSAIEGQEALFNTAVEAKEYTHLLLMDTDVIPAGNVLEELWKMDVDIAAAPVWHFLPQKMHVHLDIQTVKNGERFMYKVGEGIEDILGASFGCLLIKMEVLREFKKRGQKFCYWSSMINKKYKGHPSDSIFFAKCRKMGVKMQTNWGLQTEHYKRVPLSNLMINVFEVMRKKAEETVDEV